VSHVVRIPVRFGEVDSARIVYYPNHLHYCHVAMEETFREAIGVPYPDLLGKERLGFPAVHLDADFLETAAYGDTLEVAVSVPEVGRTSATFLFEASRASDGTAVFRARVKTVCVDMERWAPVPVPERYREAFGRLNA
jgi:4-hydroxybenzoyl-CoA thioesterase